MVIPGIGIANVPFGQLLLELREEAGLRNDGTDVPFLPAPQPDGSWSSDPLSSSEITRWLRRLLPRPASEKPLSSHSLKVTTLMWCSKFGMLRETKRVLGHHADAATGSDAVYGRELQSAALREYVLILEAVASGKFFPDQTRSGHFAPGWSREAILNAASVPTAEPTPPPDVAADQDDALAVVSDDSDSDEDETEVTTSLVFFTLFPFLQQSLFDQKRLSIKPSGMYLGGTDVFYKQSLLNLFINQSSARDLLSST